MHVNDDECHAAGVDPAEVARIARGLSRYARVAERLGLVIFGGSTGSLRFNDGGDGALILASLDGDYDGGDGACGPGADGLMRGEYA
ncbi:hypothetical protein [Pseudomonas aeruginosa]|uniref:hypothetical protein n=1 Tax=Pseudomonas aeruginosa TaxID=287 RepID=UPI0021E1BE5D|nr:hypothetical protein [Pseudomonas aeruginosa]GLF10542.1 hypothetical protein VNPA131183_40010 [Pseudomonas aeruginosa]